VAVQVQAPLVDFLRRQLPGLSVQALGATPPDGAELRLPLMSLPLALSLGSSFDACEGAYLRADEERVRKWAGRLPASGGRRIGLAWQCSRTHRRHAIRSIPLAGLAPWLEETARAGLDVVVLHNDVSAGERQALRRFSNVHVPGEALADIDDTAAVLALVDHIVSVDTAVLHLAGGMGRPATLLLQHAPDFRWGLDRESCGLYPTVAIRRQPAPGDWSAVIRSLIERTP
jgi:ADP-heptose:LPS heptosyltransferase